MHDLAKYAAAPLCPGGTQGRRFVKAPPPGMGGRLYQSVHLYGEIIHQRGRPRKDQRHPSHRSRPRE